MSFNHRDIRPAMDVYTLDNVYLGPVLEVIPGSGTPVKEQVFPEARPPITITYRIRKPPISTSIEARLASKRGDTLLVSRPTDCNTSGTLMPATSTPQR